jgi:protein gp37
MSAIDWLQGGPTVNFFTGCGSACPWCYARDMAHRLAHIEGTVYQRVRRVTDSMEMWHSPPCGGDPFAPALHLDVMRAAEERLAGSRKPKRVFVGSMGDMCFDGAALAWGPDGQPMTPLCTGAVQGVVASFARHLPQHTVLALTKRPDLLVPEAWTQNVHLGVSVTRVADADRVAALLGYARGLPEAARPGVLWASVEPLLDPAFDPEPLCGLGWVVVGLGSGRAKPHGPRREALLDAARGIVAWCAAMGVPCWCKDSVATAGADRWPRELPAIKG